MAAVPLEVSPSFYKKFSKNRRFISGNTYEKYIVSIEYCISRLGTDKMWFLRNCRYRIILLGNIKELLQNMEAFCFNYEHVGCPYKTSMYLFSGKIVVKNGQFFENVQRAFHFNHQNRGVDRMPSITKKTILKKKYNKHLLSSFEKTESTQTSRSLFADRIKQAKKTKIDLELIKILDCFPDCHGN